MERLDQYLIGIVVTHFAVVLVHSVGHLYLGIVPALPDAAFILVVIVGGPLVALLILRANRPFASGLLGVLMGAASAYGFDIHFLAAGPDHVLLVAPDPQTALFVVSAAVIGVLEVAALLLAALAFAAAARSPSALAGPRA